MIQVYFNVLSNYVKNKIYLYKCVCLHINMYHISKTNINTLLQDFKEVKRLKEEVGILKRRIADLQLALQNKDAIAEDFLKANLALQRDVIKDIKELKGM